MKKQLIITADGSHSLFIPKLKETCHSKHGAIAEAQHVFIKNGLKFHPKQNLKILEIGFCTGLNTILTLENIGSKKIFFTTLEPYPISEDIYNKLNFHTFIKSDQSTFLKLHKCEWEKNIPLNNCFTLHKKKVKLQDFVTEEKFDVIYFDAFAPNKQEEMWTKSVFKKCFELLNNHGFLVTYCSKGIVKRTLKDIGFEVATLTGPPKKREMIRAKKK